MKDQGKEHQKREYAGFAREDPAALDLALRVRTETALQTLKSHGLYIYDVTQPLGLFSELKRTFVSRVLVGSEGFTYKYLHLRMFAIPFEGHKVDSLGSLELKKALRSLKMLNSALKRRADVLREAHQLPEVVSADFNVILINRMGAEDERDEIQHSRRMKRDSQLANSKVRVSWHADSSLVHYSTIAVYHFLNPSQQPTTSSDEAADAKDYNWRVALRRQLDVEGPHAGRARRGGKEDLEAEIAPRMVSLGPSGSTYYMLGDFNHHHQHAVLAGNCERISTTHRVGRIEGHQVQSVIDKARRVLGTPKKCLKQWARESRMLDEIEFEWLRQWYIQGSKHAEQRRPFWKNYIEVLEELWLELENKEALKVTMLQNAARVAERRVDGGCGASLSRRERKHAETINQMGGSKVFAQMEEMLRQRQRKREGWTARAEDPLWDELPDDMRPLSFSLPQQTESSSVSQSETSFRALREQRQAYEAAEAKLLGANKGKSPPKGKDVRSLSKSKDRKSLSKRKAGKKRKRENQH